LVIFRGYAPPVLKIRNTADSDWRELLDGGAY
jgi:hypothetical protein